ncbi:unnamed protein product [Pieris macdunnoughi]|uniref:Uncharacterized protein n=1 Tax=Pieris macdunnoughi TaxID=345717 RepID=A0A821TY94_9NEOP|nr:unnamed protein product [Pieris macdunnoughi]
MDDDSQQFSLRWHNHQMSIIGALGRMLESGALSDVTLSANGVSLKAHRLVLAACSQYFEQIFKDVEDNTVVVILDCDASDLRQLLTFMYTGEVTAARKNLPSLLRLAQSLQVSGLTDANYDSTALPRENEPLKEVPNDAPINLDVSNKEDTEKLFDKELSEITRNDKLSKLDQIVQNLYTSHKIGNMTTPMLSQPVLQSLTEPSISQMEYEKKWRGGSICTICNKRLSNQYNLRVHMETHAGRRHACRACSHVSRSRDALRKHVAYRHAHSNKNSL